MSNELSIKITHDSEGKEVSLNAMNLEAANVLKLLFQSLTDLANLYGASHDVRISLKEGSIESVLIYPDTATDIDDDITKVIAGTSTNVEATRILRDIQTKIKANGIAYSVHHVVANTVHDLTPSFKEGQFRRRRTPKAEFEEQVCFISGRLFESGGKVKSNVHVDVGEDEYKVECTQEQATTLNKRLYSKVYLSVLKLTSAHLVRYRFIDSYLKEESYMAYKAFYESIMATKELRRYDIIHDKIVHTVETNDRALGELLKLMRLFDHEQCERGVLRTVLIGIKPIRQRHKAVKEAYNRLAGILRKGRTSYSEDN
jgi:hypothetical protein